MVFDQRGQRVVFKFGEQQFDLEVPAQVDGEGRDLAIAVPSDPDSVREDLLFFLPLGFSRLGFFVALTLLLCRVARRGCCESSRPRRSSSPS